MKSSAAPIAKAASSPARFDPLSLGAVLFTIVFWASAFAGIREGLRAFTPEHLALYRFLVASAVLGGYAVLKRFPLPSRPDALRILAVSVCGISLYHVLLNIGELSVPAGTASLIIAAGPVFTALLAARFSGERLNATGWIGTAVSLAGVTLIVLGNPGSLHATTQGLSGLHATTQGLSSLHAPTQGALSFTQGALLILAAALFTSVYFVFQRPILKRVPPAQFTVWSLIAGTIPMLVFLPGLGAQLAQAPVRAHLAVVYLGVFPSALAYLSWTFAISRVGAGRTTSFLYVSPVFAILIAWLWLHETPALLSVLGGLIAVGGVILVNTRGRLT
ncbi:DMT family transporter [Deinococcus aquiradiocola]|uniref:Membrane protein n=1 Tax=Deinococcus aquiradiocola TaxID=393059 RepID=A0A917PKU5_9DEIO|nr:EamA family transporter [Deinococcus aquiradiocola]GGJ82866.1 membrane protein [Deinococcus aquiradiocola]